jgi:hypothetical protein
MRKSTKVLGALAVAGVAALSGSAFTAANTLNGDNYAGYGTAKVSGATTSAIEHTLSGDGATIVSTKLTFATDLTTGHQVKAGFGTAALVSCDVTLVSDATVGPDTAVCTYTTAPSTSTATDFNVAVS